MVFGSLGGGSSPTTGWHGTLDVTCANNFEYNGTSKHAFARVEIDGSPVSDSIVFVLSGFEPDEKGVTLLFTRIQGYRPGEESVDIDGQGCATYVWHPTPDSNGQYTVQAMSHGGADRTRAVWDGIRGRN
jgi:hypothetical protein